MKESLLLTPLFNAEGSEETEGAVQGMRFEWRG
jgi:hypothetical protein